MKQTGRVNENFKTEDEQEYHESGLVIRVSNRKVRITKGSVTILCVVVDDDGALYTWDWWGWGD